MYDKDNSKGEKEVERKYTIRGSHMSEKQSESVSCSVPSESLQPHRLQLPGSSIHGISQARNLEWVAIPYSRGSSQPRAQTQISGIAGRFFTI